MSDSFADLWSTSAPSKPQTLGASKPLSSANGLGRAPTAPRNDVFAALASASASPSGSRPLTPAQRYASPKPMQPSTSGSRPTNGGDAFSDLLGGIGGSTATTNMTIAERAAKAEQDRLRQMNQKQAAHQVQAQAWAGLDSLGMGASASAPTATADDDDWLFGSTTSAPAPTNPVHHAPVAQADDWGLDDAFVRSKPSRPSASSQPSSGSVWDALDNNAPSTSGASRPDSPSNDFDFGSREYASPANGHDAGDDLLGITDRPSKPTSSARRPPPSRSPQPKAQTTSRVASPPPHVIGQLVEMGFAPQQARAALMKTVSTSGEFNVQSAAESLLSFDNDEDGGQANDRRSSPAPARTRPTPSRTNSQRDRERPNEDGAAADEILAQASKFGLSMFSKANALWKEGRERAQKAYEETARAYEEKNKGTASPKPPADGRPKWMQDAERPRKEGEDEWGIPIGDGPAKKGKGIEERERAGRQSSARNGERVPRRERGPDQDAEVKTADLFSDSGDAPATYVSPFRRRPQGAAASSSSSQAPSPAPARASKPKQAPAPARTRTFPTASSSALSSALAHKSDGTAKFKLGQYADAAEAYTRAVDALPVGHVLHVQLLNNRALARMRNGQGKDAARDCENVLAIVGDWGAGEERVVKLKIEGGTAQGGMDALDALDALAGGSSASAKDATDVVEVDLADGLAKALKRRAEAYEMMERWKSAREDWERLAGIAWVPPAMRSEAVRGVGRCKRAEAPPPPAAAKAASDLPKIRPRPKARPAARPSEALQRLQASNAAQDAEETQRAELKDAVDGRLLAWKGGKEANLRALIASLENVLWPELGWEKVGMHQLVSPGQVKVRYVKAIAKVHPDKLSAANTTLEHRMIANGVFGALNEAWLAFKQ